ncbi:hypothetical protein E3983_03400 [Legionella israelensis]|uniref:Uncharacterized protein n=1 Tax=Legionella israelensis TaxID=454 RepID=A0AAX1EEF3_9GAMM|nr:hypothetical protein [Legionella israelensis]QBR83491.1 hypothetical protein E3983_03400 [Legionella israelensis]
MEFFKELAEHQDFTIRNRKGEILAYAKDGELYSAETNQTFQAGETLPKSGIHEDSFNSLFESHTAMV